jgi:hypothetical protein
MNKVSASRFGLACGITLAIGDVACVIVKGILPLDTQIRVFNTLLHGVDITTVVREDMSIGEMALGLAGWFVIGSIFGAILATAYNVALRIGVAPASLAGVRGAR